MKPAVLLDEFSVKVYKPPLCEMRNNGQIRDISNPVSVLMLIIDFETEVSMSGIIDFIGNSTGKFAKETVAALRVIGCDSQAERLGQIVNIATAAGMTHDAIQRERAGLHEFEVTSFAKMHGNKWDAASEKIIVAEAELDYADLMVHAEKFVALHSVLFHNVLSEG